jgi:hypothetical protein
MTPARLSGVWPAATRAKREDARPDTGHPECPVVSLVLGIETPSARGDIVIGIDPLPYPGSALTMDGTRFDTLTRSLTRGSSRRGVLRLLTGGALGGLLAGSGAAPAPASHFGCRHVGEPCTRARQCCSSQCSGPKGGKTCAAHHTGGCTEAHDICQTNNHAFSKCPNVPAGMCYITTGDAPFCGDSNGSACKRCRSDRDCVRKFGYPRGSACVFLHAGPTQCDLACGAINDGDANDTVCMRPAV